jgi:hypothetical protein
MSGMKTHGGSNVSFVTTSERRGSTTASRRPERTTKSRFVLRCLAILAASVTVFAGISIVTVRVHKGHNQLQLLVHLPLPQSAPLLKKDTRRPVRPSKVQPPIHKCEMAISAEVSAVFNLSEPIRPANILSFAISIQRPGMQRAVIYIAPEHGICRAHEFWRRCVESGTDPCSIARSKGVTRPEISDIILKMNDMFSC